MSAILALARGRGLYKIARLAPGGAIAAQRQALNTASNGASANARNSQRAADAAPTAPPGSFSPARLAVIPASAAPNAVANSCTR